MKTTGKTMRLVAQGLQELKSYGVSREDEFLVFINDNFFLFSETSYMNLIVDCRS